MEKERMIGDSADSEGGGSVKLPIVNLEGDD